MTDIPPSADAELEQLMFEIQVLVKHIERNGFARQEEKARFAYIRTAVRIMDKALDILKEQLGQTSKLRSPF